MYEIATPALEHIMDVFVQAGTPIVVGDTVQGTRRIIPIVGGSVQGPRIEGRVVPAGADFQLIRSDWVADVQARYVLETTAGELIYVENTGVRHGPKDVIEALNRGEVVDPKLIYFRTAPRFETAAPRLNWLTRGLFIGSGVRHPDWVQLRFFEVK
jgi:hypothetical protein